MNRAELKTFFVTEDQSKGWKTIRAENDRAAVVEYFKMLNLTQNEKKILYVKSLYKSVMHDCVTPQSYWIEMKLEPVYYMDYHV